MKHLIQGYRNLFDIPDDIPDRIIIYRITVFTILFLILGIAIGRFLWILIAD